MRRKRRVAPTTLLSSCCGLPRLRTTLTSWLCWLISAALLHAQASDLRIQVLEGEGASHRTGSVAYTGATVRIVDISGSPIPNAKVNFRLPADGVTGLFANGSPAEEVIADSQGKASVWGIRWGTTPGATTISITAKMGALTAGTAVRVQVVPAPGQAAQPNATQPATAARTPGTRQQLITRSFPDTASTPPPTTAPPPTPTLPPPPPPPAGQPELQTSVAPSRVSPEPAPAATIQAPQPASQPSFEVAVAHPPTAAQHANAPAARSSAARSTADRSYQPSFEVDLTQRSGGAPPDAASALVARPAGKPGVILGPTLEPIGQMEGSRSKWLWIGLGIAGAVGAGFAYRMLQQRSPAAPAASTVVTPTLSLGQPVITIGKP